MEEPNYLWYAYMHTTVQGVVKRGNLPYIDMSGSANELDFTRRNVVLTQRTASPQHAVGLDS